MLPVRITIPFAVLVEQYPQHFKKALVGDCNVNVTAKDTLFNPPLYHRGIVAVQGKLIRFPEPADYVMMIILHVKSESGTHTAVMFIHQLEKTEYGFDDILRTGKNP